MLKTPTPKTPVSTLEPDKEGAWITTTQSQWKKQTTQKVEDRRTDTNSTTLPTNREQRATLVTSDCKDADIEMPGSTFHVDLFQGGKICQKLSKKQKRENNLQRQVILTKQPLNISVAELGQLQQEDPTLSDIREAAANKTKQSKYFLRDGLLYCLWIPPDNEVSNMSIDQLVLPSHCRKTILSLAHEIPLAGHLGQKKMAALFQYVREVCKACPECQRTAYTKTVRQLLKNHFSVSLWKLWVPCRAVKDTGTYLLYVIMQLDTLRLFL